MSALNYGVQSYCFRNFTDNRVVAQKVKEIGLSSIEVCAIHADFNDLGSWDKIVKTYADENVDICSIGVQTFQGHESEKDWFECARMAGAKHISAHFAVQNFQTAVPATAKLAEEYDINIGIHCHGGYMFGGSQDVLDHLMELGGERIGLCLDTAWCMQTGPHAGKPVEWVKKYGKRVHGVHYKDFVFEKNAEWKDVVVGTGNLDLPALVSELNSVGFAGMAVIEYEGDVENPEPALKECVEKMNSLLS